MEAYGLRLHPKLSPGYTRQLSHSKLSPETVLRIAP